MTYAELKNDVLDFLERQGDIDVTAKLPTIIKQAESWINRKVGGYQRDVTVPGLVASATGVVPLPTGFVGVRLVTRNTLPQRYSITGAGLTIENGANGTFDVTWIKKLTPLSDAEPTNWLLEAAPDAYLDACLMRAMVFLQNPGAAASYGASAAGAIDELTRQNMVAQYANASLRIAGPVT